MAQTAYRQPALAQHQLIRTAGQLEKPTPIADIIMFANPKSNSLNYAGHRTPVETQEDDHLIKFWNTPEKNLWGNVLDGIITEVATHLRKPSDREVQRHFQKSKMWVEDEEHTGEASFIWAAEMIASSDHSALKLIRTFRDLVSLKLSPACIDPKTFWRRF